MSRILLVEDDAAMRRGLKDNLTIEGYDVTAVGDGKSGSAAIQSQMFDLLILDVKLPGKSGFDLLREAREQGVSTPVIMLTAKAGEADKVLGLELGADDYITKPFSLRELLARVKAVLRRGEPGGGTDTGTLRLGAVDIDFSSLTVIRDGTPVDMTSREFDVLRYLVKHRNQPVTRDQLLTDVWGYDDSISSRTVDNFIVRLRQKVEADPAHPRHILTVHGTGYKLVL